MTVKNMICETTIVLQNAQNIIKPYISIICILTKVITRIYEFVYSNHNKQKKGTE